MNNTNKNILFRQFRFKLPDVRNPRISRTAVIITLYVDMTDKRKPVFNLECRTPKDPRECMHLYVMNERLLENPTFTEIRDLYLKHDHNDLHAGTPEQESVVRQGILDGDISGHNFSETCSYLKSRHVFISNDADGKAHRYGKGWIYTAIPEEDLARILYLIQIGKPMPSDIDAKEVLSKYGC